MSGRARIPAACVAGLLLLALGLPTSAAAKPTPITGHLSKSGYTVIALAKSGEVSTDFAARGKFSLRPPAKNVTLHLRDEDGIYAGPFVLATREHGKRAVVGLAGGAKLGEIKVRHADGFAKVMHKPPKHAINGDVRARAHHGVPIGAGSFGRVRSKPPRDSVRGDLDFDGIPNRLDIDDDGDLVLDKVDRKVNGPGSKRTTLATTSEDPLSLATGLGSGLAGTPNVSAGASDAEMDAVVRDTGYLLVNIPFGVAAAELDCGPPVPAGLSYCALGGTGTTKGQEPLDGLAFPSCCDEDEDGFGTMIPGEVVPGDYQNFGLSHHATSAEIRTGDVLIEHLTLSGDESSCPPPGGTSPDCTSFSSLQQFAFATVPALHEYAIGNDDPIAVPYPVPYGAPGTVPGNPIPVAASGNGNVKLTLAFWRPQRRPTSESECSQPQPGCTESEWIDMGGLTYFVNRGDAVCPQEAFSENDPNLELGGNADGALLTDTAHDQPTNVNHTFTYTLNLTRCFGTRPSDFPVGRTVNLTFKASPGEPLSGTDQTSQSIFFQRTQ